MQPTTKTATTTTSTTSTTTTTKVSNPARTNRIQKELSMLQKDPPPGVSVMVRASKNESDPTVYLDAQILPLADAAGYQGGLFELEICLSPNYPFDPPIVSFVTKIFHPNVDQRGRICLDSLKPQPAGSWQPSLNVRQVLSQIQILIGEPGLADPLSMEAADLYRNDKQQYVKTAQVKKRKKNLFFESNNNNNDKRNGPINMQRGGGKENANTKQEEEKTSEVKKQKLLSSSNAS